MNDPAAAATLISSRAIRAGAEDRFERWADRLQRSAQAAPGYAGAVQLRQTQGLQHLLFRFASEAEARAWRTSGGFCALAKEADDFSVGLIQLQPADQARFEVPSDAAAVSWKRFITTWIAVFPVLLAVSSVMRALLGGWPPALQLVPSSLILTATLQWIILPRLQRWTRIWVLSDASGRLRTG